MMQYDKITRAENKSFTKYALADVLALLLHSNQIEIMIHIQAQLFWAKAQNKIKKPKIGILKSPK